MCTCWLIVGKICDQRSSRPVVTSEEANPKLREFQYKPFQFEEELGNLIVGNSATVENAWVPTNDESLPSEGPSQEYFDHDDCSKLIESYNTTNLYDATNVVEELKYARAKKLKKAIKKGLMRSRGSLKREITQYVDSFTEVAKFLIGGETHTTDRLHASLKGVVDIIYSTEGVEVGSTLWVNTIEVLENETKRVL